MWCSARIQKYCSARIRALWHLYVITSTWFFSHIRFTHVNVYKMHVYVQFYTYMSPFIFVYVQLHQIIYKIFTSLYTWFVSSLRSAPLREKSCTYTKPKFSYTISSFRIREKVRLYEVVPLRSKITYWCVKKMSMRMLKREVNDAKIQAKASEKSLKRVVKR